MSADDQVAFAAEAESIAALDAQALSDELLEDVEHALAVVAPIDHERLARAMAMLGVDFRRPELLHLALVHRSHLNERGADIERTVVESNERLEFLGDALLGFIVAEYLYRRYPLQPEGRLTAYRASLVRTETLAAWARGFGLHELVYHARGELGPDGELRPRILAGVFEAVLGAIYLDRGMRAAKRFLRGLLVADAEQIIGISHETNYKGRLQELIQERTRATPSYRTVQATGPAHERVFVVEAVVHGRILGIGEGASKRIAQQEAARDALDRLAQEGVSDADGRPV
jgi:ribonuclease-3